MTTSSVLPDNLQIIPTTYPRLFARVSFITTGHFTNGVFASPESLVVPTVLAGFQYAVDQESTESLPLFVAVNSDRSMQSILDKKNAPQAERDAMESQTIRAKKVAIPLALQHRDRQVFVLFYDDETPNALYERLAHTMLRLETLFKWGYGTDPTAPVIEAAENFDKVFGHPLPNDTRPFCADVTRTAGQAGNVVAVDLREVIGPHGKPYISADNECLFPLMDATLSVYGRRGPAIVPNITPKPTV